MEAIFIKNSATSRLTYYGAGKLPLVLIGREGRKILKL